ncbi:MAG: hypothetical protein ABIH99_02950 [Candidatus Micrarchaeota archaeon]
MAYNALLREIERLKEEGYEFTDEKPTFWQAYSPAFTSAFIFSLPLIILPLADATIKQKILENADSFFVGGLYIIFSLSHLLSDVFGVLAAPVTLFLGLLFIFLPFALLRMLARSAPNSKYLKITDWVKLGAVYGITHGAIAILAFYAHYSYFSLNFISSVIGLGIVESIILTVLVFVAVIS